MGSKAKATTARQTTSAQKLALAVTGLVLAGLVVLGLAAQADAARDPTASAFLEGALRPAMQTKLRKSVPGLAITKVTCFVETTSAQIQGPCTAEFTVAKVSLKGTYRVDAKLDSQSRLTWTTTSHTCTDLRGRRASCTGRTSSGNGLISAQLAENNLVANGISAGAAAVKVKSAICVGVKSAKWSHAKFDDVYAQLKCSVSAKGGGSYSLLFVMAGNGYNLTHVVKK
jgi:hypothetical protein